MGLYSGGAYIRSYFCIKILVGLYSGGGGLICLYSEFYGMKNANNFQITDVQPQADVQPDVQLSICLIFCQFQLGLAYKSVA